MNIFVKAGEKNTALVVNEHQSIATALHINTNQLAYSHGTIITSFADLHDGSLVHIAPRLLGGMEIFIRSITGKAITIDVEADFTVTQLKSLIKEKDSTIADNFDLFFAGKILEDAKTLKDYEISSESVVMMVVKTK